MTVVFEVIYLAQDVSCRRLFWNSSNLRVFFSGLKRAWTLELYLNLNLWYQLTWVTNLSKAVPSTMRMTITSWGQPGLNELVHAKCSAQCPVVSPRKRETLMIILLWLPTAWITHYGFSSYTVSYCCVIVLGVSVFPSLWSWQRARLMSKMSASTSMELSTGREGKGQVSRVITQHGAPRLREEMFGEGVRGANWLESRLMGLFPETG